jgi:hypothetical protein
MDFLLGMVVLIVQALWVIVLLGVPCILFAKLWFAIEKRITGRKVMIKVRKQRRAA